MIRIDGSFGEGGGQMLRTSLSLSLATGQAFRIDKIRAGRKQPGLLRQHLTAVLAAAEVGGAQVEGAALQSQSLTFSPGAVRPGRYQFAVGTAGSATLVFQTLLPALMTAAEPSHLTIEGGTHNQAAPPYDFLERCYLPLIERMGPLVNLQFEHFGFYPAGGGRFTAGIEPRTPVRPLHLGVREAIVSRRVKAIVANLPRHIAEREVQTVLASLNWPPDCGAVEMTRSSVGPGNVVMVEIGAADVTAIFSAFGEVGVSAERVGTLAAQQARAYLACRAVADEHLTDQLLLPLALAGEGSFTAQKINLHARTNMAVIAEFLPVTFEVTPDESCTRVRVVEPLPNQAARDLRINSETATSSKGGEK